MTTSIFDSKQIGYKLKNREFLEYHNTLVLHKQAWSPIFDFKISEQVTVDIQLVCDGNPTIDATNIKHPIVY